MEWWWMEKEKEAKEVLQWMRTDVGQAAQISKSRWLKNWVRESDPVGSWPVDERLERIRSNVMSAIADLEIGQDD